MHLHHISRCCAISTVQHAVYCAYCAALQTLAANMTAWEAPPTAGMPFGANSTRYVALELHYNNPQELTGQKDVGSGIR